MGSMKSSLNKFMAANFEGIRTMDRNWEIRTWGLLIVGESPRVIDKC